MGTDRIEVEGFERQQLQHGGRWMGGGMSHELIHDGRLWGDEGGCRPGKMAVEKQTRKQ